MLKLTETAAQEQLDEEDLKRSRHCGSCALKGHPHQLRIADAGYRTGDRWSAGLWDLPCRELCYRVKGRLAV